jgi:hypothetical protein
MDLTFEYNRGLDIVIVTCDGRSSGKDFRGAIHKRVAIAEKDGPTKTLIEAKNMVCNSSIPFERTNRKAFVVIWNQGHRDCQGYQDMVRS